MASHTPIGHISAALKWLALLLLWGCDTGECTPSAAPTLSQTSAMFSLNSDTLSRPHPQATYTLALVPGTSEQWGHHTAPPEGVLLSDEFASRLDRARQLYDHQDVGLILVSGGSIDAQRPDYNEAQVGRRYLLDKGVPAERIMIDPLAQHSTTNVRNADKLAVEMGLDRILIVTTTPQSATLAPGDVATQGYYFLYHAISSFDARSQSDFGYSLGLFRRVRLSADTVAIEHCNFNRAALNADDYGP